MFRFSDIVHGPIYLLIYFTGDTDFDDTPVSLSFPAGSSVGDIQCIPITIIDDNIQEDEEFFVVTSDREDLFSDSVATIVIQDNDSMTKLPPQRRSDMEILYTPFPHYDMCRSFIELT